MAPANFLIAVCCGVRGPHVAQGDTGPLASDTKPGQRRVAWGRYVTLPVPDDATVVTTSTVAIDDWLGGEESNPYSDIQSVASYR